LSNIKIELSGNDWFNCYLHDMPKRKNQVMDDLAKHINNNFAFLKAGHEIWIAVKDHSMAEENFTVMSIDFKTGDIKLSYSGGVS